MKKLNNKNVFVDGLFAGATLSCAAAISIILSTGLPPNISLMVRATVFPMGLIVIMMCNFALFTGNIYTYGAHYNMESDQYTELLTINWLANLCGSLIMVFAIFVTVKLPAESFIAIAEQKIAKDPITLLFSGVLANICVCIAVSNARAAKGIANKSIAIFIPILFFVVMGWEHSIANMFYLPMGYVLGANVTIGQIFFLNLLPVTIGNIIGGGLILRYARFNSKFWDKKE